MKKIFYLLIILFTTGCSYYQKNESMISNVSTNSNFIKDSFGKKKRFYTRENMIEIVNKEKIDGEYKNVDESLFVKSEKFNDEMNYYRVQKFINSYNRVKLLSGKPFRQINGNSKNYGFFDPNEDYLKVPSGNIESIKEIEEQGIVPTDNDTIREIIYFNKINDYSNNSCKGITCYIIEDKNIEEDEDFSAYDTYRKENNLDSDYKIKPELMYEYDENYDKMKEKIHSPEEIEKINNSKSIYNKAKAKKNIKRS